MVDYIWSFIQWRSQLLEPGGAQLTDVPTIIHVCVRGGGVHACVWNKNCKFFRLGYPSRAKRESCAFSIKQKHNFYCNINVNWKGYHAMDFDGCFRLKMAWGVKYARSARNLEFKNTTDLVFTYFFCPFLLFSPFFLSSFLFSPSSFSSPLLFLMTVM